MKKWTKETTEPVERKWEEFYRNRHQHDKRVRTTHGVNCTGSCAWEVYVKDGIVTWELQATDYPMLEEGLRTPGAIDVTAKHRKGPRKLTFQGGTYLCPTIVHCDSFAHPLANREFLFPYASVVRVPQSDMLNVIGPSLVVTAITKDPLFRNSLLESSLIDRLNLGPLSTMQVSWDQPHEGNLFEFLYRRRALELA